MIPRLNESSRQEGHATTPSSPAATDGLDPQAAWTAVPAMPLCHPPQRGVTALVFPMESVFVAQQILISAVIIAGFVCTKTIVDGYRKRNSKVSVTVVGAGPVGLISLLVGARSGRVSRIDVYEELSRHSLLSRPYQLTFDVRSVRFLRRLGVDFDNIEGCWDCGCFFTRLSVFQEYVLSLVHKLEVPVDVRFQTKFSKEVYKEMTSSRGRKLLLVCDGSSGATARVAGLSDEFVQHTCKAYGAVAALERPLECQVPLPERRVHNLLFDLTAYGWEPSELDCHGKCAKGFSFKVFGTARHRFMCLTIPKCEVPIVKSLRTVLDRSMMRNIFLKCFNTFKLDSEPQLSDSLALKHMRFSPRLFEIKLSQRVETVAYFSDANLFLSVEGDAARCYNIHTGMDVNVGIKGLLHLSTFIDHIAEAENEQAVEHALTHKNKDSDRICREFTRTGLADYMHAAYHNVTS